MNTYTELIEVDSRAIRAIGYDGYTLTVIFRESGRRYDHPRVPAEVFLALRDAGSKGSFYNTRIRGRY